MQPKRATSDRIGGLDSIRFICALWVFFCHDAIPYIANPFRDGSLAYTVFRGVYGNFWSGPAAVIVFFVVSGFCIHRPFAGSGERPNLKEFYVRRFLRLALPMAVAIELSRLVDIRLVLFQHSILWSLLAELIYYLCYPALRAAQLRFGSWRGLVIASFFGAAAVIATNPWVHGYPMYGSSLNWLLGLPCWLLGCVVAESTCTALPPVSSRAVRAWRTAAFGGAMVCSFLSFHSPFGYPWTLTLFAVLVALWLIREIAFRQDVAPWRALEWAGTWSYSLYLMHLPAGAWFRRLFPVPSDSPLRWAAMVFFVLASCYGFYLIAELPSHLFARKAARYFRPRARPLVNEANEVLPV